MSWACERGYHDTSHSLAACFRSSPSQRNDIVLPGGVCGQHLGCDLFIRHSESRHIVTRLATPNTSEPILSENKSDVFRNYAGGVDGHASISFKLSTTPSLQGTGTVFLVDTDTGQMLLSPKQEGDYTSQLIAVDSAGATVTVREWNYTVLPSDLIDDRNGPNGESCGEASNGKQIDGVPFDKQFTCICTELWSGDNCDVPFKCRDNTRQIAGKPKLVFSFAYI